MASSLPSVLDETLFQCRLCLRQAVDPRLLPTCLHVFCRACLDQYITRIHPPPSSPAPAAVDVTDVESPDAEPPAAPAPPVPRSAAASGLTPTRIADEKKLSATDGGQPKSTSSTELTTGSPARGRGSHQAPSIGSRPSAPAHTGSPSSKKTARPAAAAAADTTDDYEVPHGEPPDDAYEEVSRRRDDDDQTYANEDELDCARRQQRESSNKGYVFMGGKATKLSALKSKSKHSSGSHSRSQSAPRQRSSHHKSSPSTPRRSPSPDGRLQQQQQQQQLSGCGSMTHSSTTAGRLYSLSSESSYIEVSPNSSATSNDCIYENNDSVDLDDVVAFEDDEERQQDGTKKRGKMKKKTSNPKDVRRWKVDLSIVPRLTRRVKTGGEKQVAGIIRSVNATVSKGKATFYQPTPQFRASTRSAEVYMGNVDRKLFDTMSDTVDADALQQSRLSYIYGSAGGTSRKADGGEDDAAGDKTSTLDRLIPVYEDFRSATMSVPTRSSSHGDVYNMVGCRPVSGKLNENLYDMERPVVPDYDLATHSLDDSIASPEVRWSVVSGFRHHHSRSLSSDFPCPVCEEPTRLADDDAPCGFVGAMQELLRSQTVGGRRCGNCERRSAATSRCLDCRQDLCTGCQQAHGWVKLTREHRVVGVADLQSGRYEREVGASLPPADCPVHPGSAATALCVPCDRLVCAECRASSEHHAGHRTTSELDVMAVRQRDFIANLVDDATTKLAELKKNGADIADYGIEFEAEREEVLKAVAEQRERLVKMVDDYCRNLVDNINQEFEFERDNVSELSTALDRSCSRVEHCTKFTRQLLEHGRPVDVVSLASTVRSSLRAAAQVPSVTIDARLQVDYRAVPIGEDDIQHLMGLVSIDRVGSKFDVGTKMAAERRPSGGTVSGDTSSIYGELTVHEPTLVSSFVARVTSDDKGCKPTAVAVTRDVDGEDASSATLIVVVDDINKKAKIFDADGNLRLEIHPDGEHRLVDPWDAAVLCRKSSAAAGRYAVTDRGAKDVKVFDEAGNFAFSFGPHLGCPWGIATNSAGQILVTDTVQRTVFVHDAVGALLFTVDRRADDGKEVKLQCPEYVAVSPVNGDIVVSDFERHTVVIFDKFGRHVTQFSGAGDKSTDYTTDSSGRRIKRQHRRRLEVPCGVAISGVEDDGHIYVADYNNRRVVRLTRNGRYVGCFASGPASTSLVCPQALDFTADGLLVVADRTSVKIFDVGISRPKREVRLPSKNTQPEVGNGSLSAEVTTTKHRHDKKRVDGTGSKRSVVAQPEAVPGSMSAEVVPERPPPLRTRVEQNDRVIELPQPEVQASNGNSGSPSAAAAGKYLSRKKRIAEPQEKCEVRLTTTEPEVVVGEVSDSRKRSIETIAKRDARPSPEVETRREFISISVENVAADSNRKQLGKAASADSLLTPKTTADAKPEVKKTSVDETATNLRGPKPALPPRPKLVPTPVSKTSAQIRAEYMASRTRRRSVHSSASESAVPGRDGAVNNEQPSNKNSVETEVW